MELLESLIGLESLPSHALLIIAIVYFYKHIKGEQVRHEQEICKLEKKHFDRVEVLKEYVYSKDAYIMKLCDSTGEIKEMIIKIRAESAKSIEILKTNQELMLMSCKEHNKEE